ncbi:MAG: helix-turn-helix transcriptional regulator [Oscillospiraceae bacterium]|nr:helix-turn-helix transcriptional regulator [Oscillospiraceae bacterium]
MGFYPRLKDLKEDADLTQKQVADLIGVSMNHYGKYERGETDIPLEKAVILAKYYNVSLDYLAGLTNEKNSKNPQEEAVIINKADLYYMLSLVRNILSHNNLNQIEKYLQNSKK